MPLTVIAQDAASTVGTPLPALSAHYLGFVAGDSASSLTAPAQLSTAADATSPSGSYPIRAFGAASPDYTIAYLPGTLTLTATPAPTPEPAPSPSPAPTPAPSPSPTAPTGGAPDPAAARVRVVTALYDDILGHDPSAANLSTWTAALARGLSTGKVAHRLWSLPEHRKQVKAHHTTGIPLNAAIADATAAARGVRLDDPSAKHAKKHK